MNSNSKTVKLDNILNIALIGVRRAAVFGAMGTNYTRSNNINHKFPTEVLFQFVPDAICDSDKTHLIEEYEKWIILCAMRELIETYCVFLDEIYSICCRIEFNKSKVQECDRRIEAYKKRGIAEKIDVLKSDFSIENPMGKYLKSIYRARNCYSHRSGIISEIDLNQDGYFELLWWSPELFIESNDGKEYILPNPFPKEGIVIENGGTIFVRFIDKIKRYKKGEYLKLSISDLSEMCFLLKHSAVQVIENITKYLSNCKNIVLYPSVKCHLPKDAETEVK